MFAKALKDAVGIDRTMWILVIPLNVTPLYWAVR